MARKTTVFFLMLLTGGLASEGGAQDATRAGSGEVLRWTSPRTQVRQVANDVAPRLGQSDPRTQVIPAGPGMQRLHSTAIAQTAAQAPVVDETGEEETTSVLKRRSASDKSRPSSTGRGAEIAESEIPVRVAARRFGGGGNSTASPSGNPAAAATPSVTATAPAGARAASAAGGKGLVIRCPSPTLQVEVVGPKSVTVGRPATYTVSVRNPGQEAATGVEIRVQVPEWIEAPTMQAGQGEVSRPASQEGSPVTGTIVWLIPEVAAGARVDLALQLVPRENRVFELGLDWSMQPPSVAATVAVQQPQLQLSVAGPKDARYGENVTLLITVANPGTGDAENVAVRLTTGANAPENIPVGTVPAGQQKQIEVQMAANQAGAIAITSDATADGDIRAETATELLVRRAELQLAVTSPAKAYTGSPVTYQVRLSNSGNAAADDTTVSVTLPVGAKLEAGTEGSQSTDNGLVWRVGSLPPGIERVFEIQCEVTAAGENRLEAKATAASGISLAEAAVTEVQALSDLKLSVTEPTGARRVGEEVAYEVVIANRGSKAAEDIHVLVQFSDGIEPVAADGSTAELAEGQVVFQPIDRLGPGQKTVLKVRARAERSGNHRFRVQVTGDNSETQLVFEGTTRFFGDATKEGATKEGAATEAPAAPRNASAAGGRPTPARR